MFIESLNLCLSPNFWSLFPQIFLVLFICSPLFLDSSDLYARLFDIACFHSSRVEAWAFRNVHSLYSYIVPQVSQTVYFISILFFSLLLI